MTTMFLFVTLQTEPVSQKAIWLFAPERKLLNKNRLNNRTQTNFVNFVSLTRCFIFKIIETLVLNADMANIKHLFGPVKLPGLSRNGSLGRVN